MSSATSSATAINRADASPTARAVVSPPRAQQPVRTLRMGTEEAAVLKLDLSDIPLPKMTELNVDGFQPSFWQRLFGKR